MSATQWFLIGSLALVGWTFAIFYSKRNFPLLGCRSCGATGKIWEPVWMAWLCFRSRRAFRLCTACSGSARYSRKHPLSR
jgi:hypothetical protein